MRRRFIFIVAMLVMASYVSFQKSRLLYLAYQSNLRQAERRSLENQKLTLLKEVHRLVPLDELYQSWKTDHQGLVFPCQLRLEAENPAPGEPGEIQGGRAAARKRGAQAGSAAGGPASAEPKTSVVKKAEAKPRIAAKSKAAKKRVRQ